MTTTQKISPRYLRAELQRSPVMLVTHETLYQDGSGDISYNCIWFADHGVLQQFSIHCSLITLGCFRWVTKDGQAID